MKKFGIVPVILLALSTLVLLVLFALKAVQNQKQLKQARLTQTAVMETQWAEQTIAAIPTETPLPTVTFTPEPTATPTLEPIIIPTPIATIGQAFVPGCDVAAFIADVTIPDGTEFDPNTKFTKTWKLYNDGTCTWNSSYQLYFVSGDQMSGPDSQQLVDSDVPPGTSIDISVELQSPEEAGTYLGYWGLKNTSGIAFGIGTTGIPVYVNIMVAGP